ncbi:copper transport outer membrane protein MctB [Tamaricihabitans halophyticus]|uniref:Copper transport outer membrane protein MctB n=1 Tax=Tamaricihabitans halophyticus TaxID=1262583 RepID=A0A4R2PVS7_9PSEU|nr:copper transporter [Tamaricihabitans halophyticus]TCP39218.1 copper transport outer membrane protein MctB [Tamaricihabitans halophyticus]
MISLRYHIVSIAAVFLALAIGVVLGSTALNGSLLSGLADQKGELGEQVATLEAERNQLNAQLDGADAFAGAVGDMAVRGQLDKRTVALVTTPDAKPTERDALTELIEKAGGEVNGEVQLTDAFTDTNKTDQLREIVTQSLPSGAQLPTASDPGTLAGGLMSSLVLLNKDNNERQASANESTAALSALAEGGFIKESEGVRPAQLAVVLTGGKMTGDAAADQASTIARFAAQLDRGGAGTVLAGGAGSAEGTGPVGVARADTAATSILSTVDNVHTASGRVSTVLALVEQLEGEVGRYGVAGNAEAPAPGVESDNP